MTYELSSLAEKRLTDFVERIGRVLGNKKRRASFAMYAHGLLSDGERKSVEPIAARACADPEKTDAIHQRLLHFIAESEWSDTEVRLESAKYALAAMREREPIETWILDDTGFLKQGSHSVGVQRQYTGSAGKITNCQIAVSLSVASRSEHLPLDFSLYLPELWIEDRARRKEAGIGKDITFKTKPELGLELIKRAIDARIPRGVLLADVAYGNSADFRAGVRSLGLHYAVAIKGDTTVWLVDQDGYYGRDRVSASEIANRAPRDSIRRITWRHGTKEKLHARFAICRVVPCHADRFSALPFVPTMLRHPSRSILM
jgi:SRSO17 transposase